MDSFRPLSKKLIFGNDGGLYAMLQDYRLPGCNFNVEERDAKRRTTRRWRFVAPSPRPADARPLLCGSLMRTTCPKALRRRHLARRRTAPPAQAPQSPVLSITASHDQS
jgi:hypothetical protein